jgi:protoheme IX farnesyltransferase
MHDDRTELPTRRGLLATLADLTKFRLNALVVMTTVAGFVVAGAVPGATQSWTVLGWCVLGTACAAASAAILNQVLEAAPDALMQRTAGRPLPTGRVRRLSAWVLALALGYAGFAILASFVNLLAAGLAVGNIVLYAAVYTPLKRYTTLNTVVGAITGALPPMIGWAAATGELTAGAWVIGGVLFLWQMPHFLALAWMLRDDYRRGGFAMLPSRDPDGALTGAASLATSLLLVPVGLLGVQVGAAGFAYAIVVVLAGAALSLLALRFAQQRTHARARTLFLASLAYLPIVLGAMCADRGAVSVGAAFRGGAVNVPEAAPREPPVDA